MVMLADKFNQIKQPKTDWVHWWRRVDQVTLACAIILLGGGICLALASSVPLAQREGLETFHFVYKQMQYGTFALLLIAFLSLRSVDFLRRFGIIGFFLGLAALLALIPFGQTYNGSTRWLPFGFVAVQPSELIKPFFVIFSAWIMTGGDSKNRIPGGLLTSLIPVVVVILLLVWQPDIAQSALIFSTWMAMVLIAGAPSILFFGAIIVLIMGGVLAYSTISYFYGRVNEYLSPIVDPTSQIGLSLRSIEQGGLLGVGIGNGSVKWSLPDAHTDFIIAVAAEEFGLIAPVIVIVLVAFIVLSSLRRAEASHDPFIRISITGLSVIFGLQAIINLGVASRLFPTTGMTLPFISNGGSSLIASGILIGVLLAFSHRQNMGSRKEYP